MGVMLTRVDCWSMGHDIQVCHPIPSSSKKVYGEGQNQRPSITVGFKSAVLPQGKTVVYVLVDDRVQGVIALPTSFASSRADPPDALAIVRLSRATYGKMVQNWFSASSVFADGWCEVVQVHVQRLSDSLHHVKSTGALAGFNVGNRCSSHAGP